MPKISRSISAPMLAKVETAYATDPSPTAALNGFLAMRSPNAFAPELQFQRFDPHTEDFPHKKDIPSFKAMPINFNFPWVGGTAANAVSRYDPILRCAGLKSAVVAGTPGSLQYTIQTLAALESATMAMQLGIHGTDSWVHEAHGVVGTVSLVGTPDEGWVWTFQGAGLFKNPEAGTLSSIFTGTWSGGADAANKSFMSGANRCKLNNGGTDYFPILKRIEFAMQCNVVRVKDMNAGGNPDGAGSGGHGYALFMIGSMDPVLRVTIALDLDPAANIPYDEFFEDADDTTVHNVTWKHSDLQASPRTFTSTFATAQIRNISNAEEDEHRTSTVEYKVQGTQPLLIQQD